MDLRLEKEFVQVLTVFMAKAVADARVGLPHISLYVALLCYWYEQKGQEPLYIFSHDMKPLSKLAGSATYHRSIRQLHAYGYLRYVPSNNHYLGSLVYLKVPS